MNIQKINFKSFLFGFVLAAGAFVTMSFLSKSTLDSPIIKDKTVDVSEAISWADALSMKAKFVALQPLSIEVSNGVNTTVMPLEGFRVEAAHLLEIIQNNKMSNGQKADNVVFYFGAKDPKPGMTQPEYNLIAVGESRGVLMVPSDPESQQRSGSSSVFDKANPCPPMCPSQQ